MTGSASFGMYDFPWLRSANDALWVALRRHLGADVPLALDRSRDLIDIWRDEGLVLAQTCGYPLVTALMDTVRVVATPVYDLPGCAEGRHCSFVVVRAGDPAASLQDLRGRRAAINAWDSNSGMNLLRAAIAPLAITGRFFGGVTVTGAHLDSLVAVRAGMADTAAIDCVTYGLTARDRPDLIKGVRILAHTPASPALPFVTRGDDADETVAALRAALAAVLPWPELALAGVIEPLDYAPVLALEREAAARGYAVLA